MNSTRFWALAGLVLAAVAFRLLPAPANFSPIAAIALFAGFSFRHRLAAVALPLVALLISDALIGFHDLMWAVYLSFALTSLLGVALRDQKGAIVKGSAAIAASVLFFVITNFAVWAQSGMYPRTYDGLIACFVAALPFFDNAIAGDLIFTFLLFAAWSLAERQVPALRKSNA